MGVQRRYVPRGAATKTRATARSRRLKAAATKHHNKKLAKKVLGTQRLDSTRAKERRQDTVARRNRGGRKTSGGSLLPMLKGFGHDITQWLGLIPGERPKQRQRRGW